MTVDHRVSVRIGPHRLARRGELTQQEEFVRWWRETVSVRLHASSKVSADRRSPLSEDQAKKLTGITHQQVAKDEAGP